MKIELNQLAKKFIEGEWSYDKNEKTLKKFFASSKELSELELIDAEGYLDLSLKSAILHALGDVLLNNVVGPFGDGDFFSGDILDDEVFYNLELHQVSPPTLEALQKIPNVKIK